MKRWVIEVVKKLAFALSTALLGILFSSGAAIVLGIAGWIHGLLFPDVYSLPPGELFLVRMFSGFLATLFLDLPLVFWSILLSIVIYKRKISFGVSFLLMLIVSAPTLAFFIDIGIYFARLDREIFTPHPSFVETVTILFMGMLWLGCETASFALALARPWRP